MISCGQNFHIELQNWDTYSGVLSTLKIVESNDNEKTIQVLAEGITNNFTNILKNRKEANLPLFL